MVMLFAHCTLCWVLGWWNRKAEYEITGSWECHGTGVQCATLREIPSPLDGIALCWKTPASLHTHCSVAPRLLKGIFFPTFLFSLILLWRIFFFSFMQLVLHNNKKGCYLGSNLHRVSTSVDFAIFCSTVGQVALSLTCPWHIFRVIFLQQAQKTQSWVHIPILFQKPEWRCWPEYSESFVMDLQVSVCPLGCCNLAPVPGRLFWLCRGFSDKSVEDGWCRIL